MNTLTFQKNDVIFRQDDLADTMYRILSGSVRIVSDFGKESEKELSVLKDGDFFGEMGLAECFPRSASAVVCSETAKITEFDADDFQRIFKEEPELITKILRQLAQRLDETDREYLEAVETVRKAKGDQAITAETGSMLRRLHDFYLSILNR